MLCADICGVIATKQTAVHIYRSLNKIQQDLSLESAFTG